MFRTVTLAVTLLMALAPALRADEVIVFAASSLKTALDDIAEGFETATGHRALISYGGSSMLARQIAQGAPAGIFISANSAWMEDLAARDLLRGRAPVDLLSNRLVLIAPEGAPEIALGDLPAALGEGRLAMGMVESVPVGIYGKAALDTLDLWQGLSAHVVQTDSARAALALVARRELAMGVVYATDAVADPRVIVIAPIPESSHPPILYPAVRLSDDPAAGALWDHLLSDRAAEVFARHGFGPAGRAP